MKSMLCWLCLFHEHVALFTPKIAMWGDTLPDKPTWLPQEFPKKSPDQASNQLGSLGVILSPCLDLLRLCEHVASREYSWSRLVNKKNILTYVCVCNSLHMHHQLMSLSLLFSWFVYLKQIQCNPVHSTRISWFDPSSGRSELCLVLAMVLDVFCVLG